MRPKHLLEFLRAAIKARQPVLVTSSPGVGKSSLFAQAAQEEKAAIIYTDLATADPTQAAGFPWMDKDAEHAKFFPFGDLHRALTAKEPTVWIFEDLGWAPPSVQNAFCHLIHERRSNDFYLPDCVTIGATSNRRTDKAGVQGILEPVKSRFASIVQLDPHVDDLCEYAYTKDWELDSIAFLRFRPDLLLDFQPTADLTNSPSPRTWEKADQLFKLSLPSAIEFEAIAGAVGKGAAAERIAFRKVWEAMPSLDQILLDPDTAPLPIKGDQAATLYAVCVGLAARAKVTNFDRIARYASRLADASKGEFGALLVRDASRREPKICLTPAFQKLITSTKLGALIQG